MSHLEDNTDKITEEAPTIKDLKDAYPFFCSYCFFGATKEKYYLIHCGTEAHKKMTCEYYLTLKTNLYGSSDE